MLGDAYLRSRLNGRSQAENYEELLKERKDSPCTPEQQAGTDAGIARKIIEMVADDAIRLVIVRHIAADDDEPLDEDEIVSDTTACLVGDDCGCLDPDDPQVTALLRKVEALVREAVQGRERLIEEVKRTLQQLNVCEACEGVGELLYPCTGCGENHPPGGGIECNGDGGGPMECPCCDGSKVRDKDAAALLSRLDSTTPQPNTEKGGVDD